MIASHMRKPVRLASQASNEGWIPFARSNLKIVNGIKPLAIFEFYEKSK
jgi:hypothetical protein